MSAPVVDLDHPWPLDAPHPVTGWRPPQSRIRLPDGAELTCFEAGDAVPGGYNGTFVLRGADGSMAGALSYNSAARSVVIAMIEVAPNWRRRGVSNALLMRLLAEFDDARVSGGLLTADGARWWKRVEPVVIQHNAGVRP